MMRLPMTSFRPGLSETFGQILALSGPVSATVFALTHLMFAAWVDGGYSSSDQMVSELGASGAPHASAFNLFGFILPGLLIVVLAVGLKRELQLFAAPTLLGLCGVSFATVGLFPLEYSLPGAVANFMHVTAAQLCGFLFIVASVLLSIPMRKHPCFMQLSRLTPGLACLLTLNVVYQLAGTPEASLPPGLSQRIGLVGYFAWLTFAGMSLLVSVRKRRDGTPLTRERLMRRPDFAVLHAGTLASPGHR